MPPAPMGDGLNMNEDDRAARAGKRTLEPALGILLLARFIGFGVNGKPGAWVEDIFGWSGGVTGNKVINRECFLRKELFTSVIKKGGKVSLTWKKGASKPRGSEKKRLEPFLVDGK